MRQTYPEVDLVIQPAAGIANYGLGGHSTASIHFALLRRIVSKQLRVPVLEPLFPKGFGLLGSTSSMSEKFARDLDNNLAEFPNARVLLVGHSLGGIMCREQTALHPERERFIGALTLGTPHRGVPAERWRRFDSTVRNLNSFVRDIQAAHEDDGERSGLAMIATTLDIMVPSESALPDIAGKARHIFAQPGADLSQLGNVERHLNTGIDHNGLVIHPQAIRLLGQVARHMIEPHVSLPVAI